MKKLLVLAFICFFYSEINLAQTSNSTSTSSELLDAVKWREVGPWRGGRSCAVTGVPGKPNLFYMGSTGGGVWKSNDTGNSWENISDGFFGGSIGSIAVAESDNNVIYVGGGEKTVRGNVSYGYGMWKSVDAGKTWESKGLPKSRHIPRVRIHPKNPDIVYAAVLGNLFAPNAERGVYKSTDGGDSWKKVLFVSSEAGAVDLIIDPTNARNLYATTWNVRRTPYSLDSGGPGSSLWKSTDEGETWKEIKSNKGLPKGVWGISGVTVSPVNGDRIWVLVENKDGGLYRSDDGGETWKMINNERALRQRAWYYTRLYADTQDEDLLYVVNVNYHQSRDGGVTFKSKRAPHGDHHDLWIAPEDPTRMIIGDDGGAQVSIDRGETWTTYHNQPTAQFYRVTTDNHVPYRIYVAQQDNSTLRILHNSKGGAGASGDWEPTAGGESAHIAIDPTDNDIVYGGSYGGFLTRKDHKNNSTQAINVWPDNPMGYGAEGMKYRFQWNFPIFFSKHNPKKLYSASQHLHVTTNEGKSWEIISPDLTRNDAPKLVSSGGPITQDNTGVEYYCTIFAIDESPLKEGLIWAGSDDGLIHLTRDGGKNWENVTPKGIPEWLMINCIEPDPFDEAGCYMAGTLYKGGDFKPYLYKTKDYGKTWTKIVNGIDREHFTRAIRSDKKTAGILYAGTETGIYISFDDGANWKPFQQNLPIVPVTDLTIKDDNLIAATQGRGIWIIDDLTLVHQLAEGVSDKSLVVFKPTDVIRMGGNKAMVNYFIEKFDEEKDTVSISLLDNNGQLIKSFNNKAKDKSEQIEVKQGANSFEWNLSYPDAKKFDGMIMWWGSMDGPKAMPGEYQVKINHNDKEVTQNFNIKADPRGGVTLADYEKQFEFQSAINKKLTEAHESIETIRDLKKQLGDYKKRVEDYPDIIAEISRVDSTLSAVEKNLYQTQNRSRQDPLNFPIKLTNKLAHLNSLSQISDGAPTTQSLAVKEEMIMKIDKELEDYTNIIRNDIPKLNELISQSLIQAIVPKVDKP